MQETIILYPAIMMMILTIFLYVKNYLDNFKAMKNKELSSAFFKAYQGEVPENVEVSRQTLKNQFELPIFFYFLITLILILKTPTALDLIFAWLFVISRYMHCYVRLTSNYVPFRAKIFTFGFFTLIIWWIVFLSTIL